MSLPSIVFAQQRADIGLAATNASDEDAVLIELICAAFPFSYDRQDVCPGPFEHHARKIALDFEAIQPKRRLTVNEYCRLLIKGGTLVPIEAPSGNATELDATVARRPVESEVAGESHNRNRRNPIRSRSMGAEQTFVIVGAGLAGAKAAEALRSAGFNGRILLFGAESERPYERPALSKSLLQGTSERAKIYVHPKQWYADHDIELHTSTMVTAIDRAAREIELATGKRLAYNKLLLTTGASPRQLPDAGPHSVYYLRRVEDSLQLRFAFTTAKRVVIIGGGWIGLEVAAAARAANVEVILLERGEVPLLHILGRETAEVFAQLHRAHGVEIRTDAHLGHIITNDDGRAIGVQLNDGSRVDADLVVVGVGALPNTSLAEDAGLLVDNGIKVDQHLRTSDPNIFAAGDVANAFHPMLGVHIRSEHWFNALSQPAVAAKSMVGLEASYDEVPYFYSDQYELGMEYSGHVDPGDWDQVIFRGDKDTLEFVVFWLKDHKVLAGMNVNIWDVTEVIKDLVRSSLMVDGVKLADAAIPLAEVLVDAKNMNAQR